MITVIIKCTHGRYITQDSNWIKGFLMHHIGVCVPAPIYEVEGILLFLTSKRMTLINAQPLIKSTVVWAIWQLSFLRPMAPLKWDSNAH